jgi:4-hydroxybenzoate polyprenyltransferase
MKTWSHQVLLLIISMRPTQWTKNVLIFAALVFSQNLFDLVLLAKTLIAFVIYCLLSGSLYIVNDLLDLEKDRQHPRKGLRPLASGQLGKRFALWISILISVPCLLVSLLMSLPFGIVTGGYALLHLAYSYYLKHIVIVDIFCIALGFVLRVFAGAFVIGVTVSSWLMVCTLSLALFLGFSKRRYELVALGERAVHHRKALGEYSISFLDQMIAVTTSSAVLSYALYTISEETVKRFETTALVYTVPFVIYGIFRYLYLTHQRQEGGEPEKLLLTDIPLMINILLYLLVTGSMIYLYY